MTNVIISLLSGLGCGSAIFQLIIQEKKLLYIIYAVFFGVIAIVNLTTK